MTAASAPLISPRLPILLAVSWLFHHDFAKVVSSFSRSDHLTICSSPSRSMRFEVGSAAITWQPATPPAGFPSVWSLSFNPFALFKGARNLKQWNSRYGQKIALPFTCKIVSMVRPPCLLALSPHKCVHMQQGAEGKVWMQHVNNLLRLQFFWSRVSS